MSHMLEQELGLHVRNLKTLLLLTLSICRSWLNPLHVELTSVVGPIRQGLELFCVATVFSGEVGSPKSTGGLGMMLHHVGPQPTL